MTERQNTITNCVRVIFLVTAVDYEYDRRLCYTVPQSVRNEDTDYNTTAHHHNFSDYCGSLLVFGPAWLTTRIPVATRSTAGIRTSTSHHQNSSSYAVRCWYSNQHGSPLEYQ